MSSASPAVREPDRGRLAVLPLTSIGPEAGDEYFADGMTEELISTLSRIGGLRVIARTSAMRFKGSDRPLAVVAKELDVRTVLDGSVRKAGGKLRIDVRLIDATTEEHLWGQTYDGDLEEIFDVQRTIAQRVARALRVRIAPLEEEALERRPTAVLDAYTGYLRGRAGWNLRTEPGLREAVRRFEEAIGKDARFTLAYAGLADAYAALAALEFVPPTEAFPKAREAAEQALALDERSAEAQAALGLVLFQYERDWAGSEKALREAVALNPNYPPAHQYLADLLKALGRFDEATAEMRAALVRDPLSMPIATGLGHVLYLARRYEESIAQYRAALRLDPTFVLAHLWFGRPYLQLGRYDEAIEEVRQAVQLSGGSTMSLAVLAHALASAGRTPEAREILGRLMERAKERYLPSYWIALVHTGLGDEAEALRWLERAYEERSSWLVWIGVEPRFDRLRGRPEFDSLLERMRLPGPALAGPDAEPGERGLAEILARMTELSLPRYRVVGSYARFEEADRQRLKDLRQRIAARFEPGAGGRDNFLLWGAPGTGKTFFVREVAASLPAGTRLVELNLAERGEEEFRSALATLRTPSEPTLLFVDEVDSRPTEPWPYEAMLPVLDLAAATAGPRVALLAGSGGGSLDGMKEQILRRPKGPDLVSRLPRENEFLVPPPSPSDRVLLVASTVRQARSGSGRDVREIEKLALYYLAQQPDLANPRQLRDRVRRALDRVPSGDDRLQFDQLFHPGDPGNKEFWLRSRERAPALVRGFLRVED